MINSKRNEIKEDALGAISLIVMLVVFVGIYILLVI